LPNIFDLRRHPLIPAFRRRSIILISVLRFPLPRTNDIRFERSVELSVSTPSLGHAPGDSQSVLLC
jgi:hypothetical protein